MIQAFKVVQNSVNQLKIYRNIKIAIRLGALVGIYFYMYLTFQEQYLKLGSKRHFREGDKGLLTSNNGLFTSIYFQQLRFEFYKQSGKC